MINFGDLFSASDDISIRQTRWAKEEMDKNIVKKSRQARLTFSMSALQGRSVGPTCGGCGEPSTPCLDPGWETSAILCMVSPDCTGQASFWVQTGTPYHPDHHITPWSLLLLMIFFYYGYWCYQDKVVEIKMMPRKVDADYLRPSLTLVLRRLRCHCLRLGK